MKNPINKKDNKNKKDKPKCIKTKENFIIRKIMEIMHNKRKVYKIRSLKNKLNKKMDKN